MDSMVSFFASGFTFLRHGNRLRSTLAILWVMILVGAVPAAFATPQWRVLPNAPDQGASNRHDDLDFVDEQTGWVCNLSGQTWKTTNGGASWDNQPAAPLPPVCISTDSRATASPRCAR
jgi:photosystem II stability/assembly factor-like uncharacterized protein